MYTLLLTFLLFSFLKKATDSTKNHLKVLSNNIKEKQSQQDEGGETNEQQQPKPRVLQKQFEDRETIKATDGVLFLIKNQY